MGSVGWENNVAERLYKVYTRTYMNKVYSWQVGKDLIEVQCLIFEEFERNNLGIIIDNI